APSSASRLLFRALPYGNSKRLLVVRDITRLHKLEKMRRDFVANVSHELRSPLTVVVGYLEGMGEDEQLPENFHRPVQQMARQTARMTRIVEDLLRLSRIESEPNAAVHTAIKMGDLVASLLRDAQRITTGEHVFEHHVDHTVLLLGDYNEVYSALSNLLFNAVQYTPAGGRIELNWLADENGARFEVRDSGEGIEAHHLSRLTERFYRVDKARSQSIGGTGLGLAIVKHVLMRHDAQLGISSEIDKGSVFSCEFPASRVDYEPAQIDTLLDARRAPLLAFDHDAAPTALSSDTPRG
ncbi:MAG: two-component system phosphate regulon sensor histidine kinase PhoR, partial [Gammaproteobacteria bacterium]